MVFRLFSKELQELIRERFAKPTEIQTQGIPHIIKGKNTLLIGPTGTGKTESCLLPTFNFWLKEQPKPISILYITPLRSLNRDLLKRILWWAEKLGMEVSVRHGDTSQYERSMQAQNPVDLLISTPETLQAVIVGKLMRKHLSNVRWIIIDEIHELVDNKRGVQLSVGLERLKEIIKNSGNKEPQIIGLSATVGNPKKVAKFLVSNRECEIIDIARVENFKIEVESPKPSKKDFRVSSEILISPEITARLNRIDELIKTKNSMLIFTNTREHAEVLSSRLRLLDPEIAIATHHSSLSKEVRIGAENKFKDNELKALVCTSSLELGIDIGLIDFILQYHSPRQVTKIIQRVGRSGHLVGRTHVGVILASDADDCFESCITTKLALAGKIEGTNIYNKALDVLAHQVIGLALEEYKIPLERVYDIIKKALPYKDLTKEELIEVCNLLQKLGFIWLDVEFPNKLTIKRRKQAWQYYYQNLSTIPDVKHYRIIDLVSNKSVGTLDAEFIALHANPGTAFICNGKPWKILELKADRVIVEPIESLEAAIPAWEGELIPVPFEVAQEVGKLRKEIAEKIKNEDIVDYLISNYNITQEVAENLIKIIRKQLDYGFVPTNKEILIEYANVENGYWVILHTCFGSLVNETIGRLLSIFLSNKLGSVGLQTDPYRIMIKLQIPRYEEVIETFKSIKPENVGIILELALQNTELFAYRFLHVAQRFGIIAREADYGKGYLKKIIESYANTPVCKEVLNEIESEKLDIDKAAQVLELVKNSKIIVKRGLSPLGAVGLERKYEIIGSKEKEIFKIFKKRLLDTKIRLICCNCGEFAVTYMVKDLPELICPKCDAKLIAVIKPWESEKENLLKKFLQNKVLTKKEIEIVNLVLDSASLVMTYGANAVKVFAAHGVGLKTAIRILSKLQTGDELLKDILNAEKTFARTHRYWH